MRKTGVILGVATLLGVSCPSLGFLVPSVQLKPTVCRNMAGKEGGEEFWVMDLLKSAGKNPAGEFDKQLKMKGLRPNKDTDPKIVANNELIRWLEDKGDVWLKTKSDWGKAPHPLGISTETRDEITKESSGRGLLARETLKEGDPLLKIPFKLCLTRDSARNALGKDAIAENLNEYLAIACQLIHEKYVMKEKSFYKPYIGILPEVKEVNPSFTWSDEELSYLEGSPLVVASKSLRNKVKNEYDALIGGENGLCNRFPERFPKEVCQRRLFPNR